MSAKTIDQQESSTDNAHCPTNDSANTDLVYLLSQLHLPRMNPDAPPTLRILAVADIDLASAAALAEYALHESDLGGGNVDLCIACGPFCRDQDIQTRYLQGRSKVRHGQKSPHTRSREETAALEGLMSGALSQLESIVCRVVFLPHPTDPCTTLNKKETHLRLTPNAVNVEQRWLQLAPGIGCCGCCELSNETETDGVHVQPEHTADHAHAVTRLLDLGPSTSPLSPVDVLRRKDVLFSLHVAQAILVTQTANHTRDVLDWPEEHSRFLDSPRAQMQVVLNVASGPPSVAPVNEKRGNVQLVAPGSLRVNGDFALIDLALYQNTLCKTAVAPERRTYSWGVDRVEFRNMKRV